MHEEHTVDRLKCLIIIVVTLSEKMCWTINYCFPSNCIVVVESCSKEPVTHEYVMICFLSESDMYRSVSVMSLCTVQICNQDMVSLA